MAGDPYKSGQKAYASGNWINSYVSESSSLEWQRGFDDAEAEASKKQDAAQSRRDALWNVPERARDAYIDMEDNFGPETVLEFMKAYTAPDP